MPKTVEQKKVSIINTVRDALSRITGRNPGNEWPKSPRSGNRDRMAPAMRESGARGDELDPKAGY